MFGVSPATIDGMYGAFIRQVRESRGLSQKQVAESAGLTQSNLSAIENDRRVPTIDTVNRVLVACGYELTAVGGSVSISAPLPVGRWFPDDDLPPRLPDDPPDEEPVVNAATPPDERVRVMNAVLDMVSG